MIFQNPLDKVGLEARVLGYGVLVSYSRRRKLRQNANSDGPIVPRWHGETYALRAFAFEFTNLPLAQTQLR